MCSFICHFLLYFLPPLFLLILLTVSFLLLLFTMFYLLPSFNGGLFLWVSHLLWNGTVRCWESGLGYVECQFRYVAPMLLVSKSVAHSIMRALVILVSPCGLTGKASVVTYTSVLCDHLVFISFSLAIIISSCKADVHTLLHPS